nr:MAG TPA: hypothetical protein [Caudoviricetes sp.]
MDTFCNLLLGAIAFPPCLYANSDVHTIPAVFSEICRCYFPEVSVMVTPATAINLS